MRQFQVPQFIDVEDKIFGPLTWKQFAYLLVGGLITWLTYKVFPKVVFMLIGMPIGGFALALAFYKPNNRPFILMVRNALKFFSGPRLYLWKKIKAKKIHKQEEITKETKILETPGLTESKLKELAWSLDIHKKIDR